MSELRETDNSVDQAPIQIDTFGIKVKLQRSGEEVARPKSWREVWSRFNQNLMTIVERLFGLPADLLVGVSNVTRGLGGMLVRPNPASHHQEADRREEARQDVITAQATGAPTLLLPLESPQSAAAVLEDLLNEFQATKGITAGIRRLDDGRMVMFLLPPESVEPAAELAQEESLLLEESVVQSDPEPTTEQSLSVLGLPVRVHRILEKQGIRTVEDLMAETEGEIIAIPGIGTKAIQEILQALRRLGLSLRKGQ
jgi:hypothetical protein